MQTIISNFNTVKVISKTDTDTYLLLKTVEIAFCKEVTILKVDWISHLKSLILIFQHYSTEVSILLYYEFPNNI